MNMAETTHALSALTNVPEFDRGTKLVGIRPEHLRVARKEGMGRVTAIEPLGTTTVLSVGGWHDVESCAAWSARA